ncbi:MerR family transcriptional regulator [Bacillus amyloliquefaciens]
MTADEQSYKDKKVISIGIVSELTGLSVRQIRYYEVKRKLIYPQRSSRGTRKYSFADVERLMDIANKREDGVQTAEILKDMRKKEQALKNDPQLRKKMLEGQLNAHFKYKNR